MPVFYPEITFSAFAGSVANADVTPVAKAEVKKNYIYRRAPKKPDAV